MIVVADTGPLISLAVIDKLDLLDTLFGQVVIPEAVWHELEKHIAGLSLPKLKDFQNRVVPISQPISVLVNFGLGEQEAIQLFNEIHGDLLLVEDQGARELAEARGIPCTGSLGVLLEAKRNGLIGALRPFFMEMLARRRFFTIQLLNTTLTASGEAPL
jgi:predicted nucleic acid-binding protein